MSKHGSGRLFIRVVCTDMYIDRQTGIRCARHQQFRLGRLPVFIEQDQDGNAVPGTEYVGFPRRAREPAHRPSAAQNADGRGQRVRRYSDEGGAWSRIVRHWLDAHPKRSVLVVDISDPVYSWWRVAAKEAYGEDQAATGVRGTVKTCGSASCDLLITS